MFILAKLDSCLDAIFLGRVKGGSLFCKLYSSLVVICDAQIKIGEARNKSEKRLTF